MSTTIVLKSNVGRAAAAIEFMCGMKVLLTVGVLERYQRSGLLCNFEQL